MLRTEQFFFECEGTLIERFRLCTLPLRLLEGSQVIQVDGALVMLRTVAVLEDLERASINWLGFAVSALPIQNRGQRGEIGCRVDVIRPKSPFTNFHRAACERFSTRIVTGGVFQSPKVVINGGHFS